jgi:hypothetical protein
MSTPHGLPAALVEYAEQLLAGTGVSADQALQLAQTTDDPDTTLVAALRAGWTTPELAERADQPVTTEEEQRP